MAEIASWNGHKWEVTPSMITSFTKLQIKGSMETEDKSGKKQKWVAFKNSKAAEISFNMTLSRLLGVEDVKAEVDSFFSDASSNTQDFFLLNGEKLFTCKFLLTDVTADTIVLSPSGVWISADLKFTFKQSSKLDASDSSTADDSTSTKKKSSSGSSKKSTTSAKQTTSTWNSDVYSGSSSHDNNPERSSSAKNNTASGLAYRTAQADAAKTSGKAASATKTSTTKTATTKLSANVTIKKA